MHTNTYTLVFMIRHMNGWQNVISSIYACIGCMGDIISLLFSKSHHGNTTVIMLTNFKLTFASFWLKLNDFSKLWLFNPVLSSQKCI